MKIVTKAFVLQIRQLTRGWRWALDATAVCHKLTTGRDKPESQSRDARGFRPCACLFKSSRPRKGFFILAICGLRPGSVYHLLPQDTSSFRYQKCLAGQLLGARSLVTYPAPDSRLLTWVSLSLSHCVVGRPCDREVAFARHPPVHHGALSSRRGEWSRFPVAVIPGTCGQRLGVPAPALRGAPGSRQERRVRLQAGIRRHGPRPEDASHSSTAGPAGLPTVVLKFPR